jgi:hypothetical protein
MLRLCPDVRVRHFTTLPLRAAQQGDAIRIISIEVGSPHGPQLVHHATKQWPLYLSVSACYTEFTHLGRFSQRRYAIWLYFQRFSESYKERGPRMPLSVLHGLCVVSAAFCFCLVLFLTLQELQPPIEKFP